METVDRSCERPFIDYPTCSVRFAFDQWYYIPLCTLVALWGFILCVYCFRVLFVISIDGLRRDLEECTLLLMALSSLFNSFGSLNTNDLYYGSYMSTECYDEWLIWSIGSIASILFHVYHNMLVALQQCKELTKLKKRARFGLFFAFNAPFLLSGVFKFLRSLHVLPEGINDFTQFFAIGCRAWFIFLLLIYLMCSLWMAHSLKNSSSFVQVDRGKMTQGDRGVILRIFSIILFGALVAFYIAYTHDELMPPSMSSVKNQFALNISMRFTFVLAMTGFTFWQVPRVKKDRLRVGINHRRSVNEMAAWLVAFLILGYTVPRLLPFDVMEGYMKILVLVISIYVLICIRLEGSERDEELIDACVSGFLCSDRKAYGLKGKLKLYGIWICELGSDIILFFSLTLLVFNDGESSLSVDSFPDALAILPHEATVWIFWALIAIYYLVAIIDRARVIFFKHAKVDKFFLPDVIISLVTLRLIYMGMKCDDGYIRMSLTRSPPSASGAAAYGGHRQHTEGRGLPVLACDKGPLHRLAYFFVFTAATWCIAVRSLLFYKRYSFALKPSLVERPPATVWVALQRIIVLVFLAEDGSMHVRAHVGLLLMIMAVITEWRSPKTIGCPRLNAARFGTLSALSVPYIAVFFHVLLHNYEEDEERKPVSTLHHSMCVVVPLICTLPCGLGGYWVNMRYKQALDKEPDEIARRAARLRLIDFDGLYRQSEETKDSCSSLIVLLPARDLAVSIHTKSFQRFMDCALHPDNYFYRAPDSSRESDFQNDAHHLNNTPSPHHTLSRSRTTIGCDVGNDGAVSHAREGGQKTKDPARHMRNTVLLVVLQKMLTVPTGRWAITFYAHIVADIVPFFASHPAMTISTVKSLLTVPPFIPLLQDHCLRPVIEAWLLLRGKDHAHAARVLCLLKGRNHIIAYTPCRLLQGTIELGKMATKRVWLVPFHGGLEEFEPIDELLAFPPTSWFPYVLGASNINCPGLLIPTQANVDLTRLVRHSIGSDIGDKRILKKVSTFFRNTFPANSRFNFHPKRITVRSSTVLLTVGRIVRTSIDRMRETMFSSKRRSAKDKQTTDGWAWVSPEGAPMDERGGKRKTSLGRRVTIDTREGETKTTGGNADGEGDTPNSLGVADHGWTPTTKTSTSTERTTTSDHPTTAENGKEQEKEERKKKKHQLSKRFPRTFPITSTKDEKTKSARPNESVEEKTTNDAGRSVENNESVEKEEEEEEDEEDEEAPSSKLPTLIKLDHLFVLEQCSLEEAQAHVCLTKKSLRSKLVPYFRGCLQSVSPKLIEALEGETIRPERRPSFFRRETR